MLFLFAGYDVMKLLKNGVFRASILWGDQTSVVSTDCVAMPFKQDYNPAREGLEYSRKEMAI